MIEFDVLLSVKEKWVKKILAGEKTVEVRKTRPRLQTPFICYLYQSGTGFVVGEFICKYVDQLVKVGSSFQKSEYMRREGDRVLPIDYTPMQLTREELEAYGGGAVLYAWHISRVRRYQMPEPLKCFGVSRPPQSWRYVLRKTA